MAQDDMAAPAGRKTGNQETMAQDLEKTDELTDESDGSDLTG
ncbi:MAG: hypothetical protein NZ528_07545 [Caldilineales bacterium]|nr:hypothetical protein [Caldilineales bacterium]MDW8318767.1 hypothetical protein [Anaerolineae bacterium]